MLLKALTLQRPWPTCIFNPRLRKRVENRTWSPPESAIGQRFAIHAGKTYDAEGESWIEDVLEFDLPLPEDQPTGIIGVVTLKSVITEDEAGEHDMWWNGPYGWVLDNVIELPRPVPCRGAQGLWPVALADAEEVYRMLKDVGTVSIYEYE